MRYRWERKRINVGDIKKYKNTLYKVNNNSVNIRNLKLISSNKILWDRRQSLSSHSHPLSDGIFPKWRLLGNFFASFHPGWQDRAIGSHLSEGDCCNRNNRADDRTDIDRVSRQNGGRDPTRSDGTDDDAGSGAHPRSDVGLDKWRLAIKSIRRDMALVLARRDTSRCVASLFMRSRSRVAGYRLSVSSGIPLYLACLSRRLLFGSPAPAESIC